MKKKWMKNENGWLNCPIYCLLLENIVCASFFEMTEKSKLKQVDQIKNMQRKKIALFEEQKARKPPP